VASRIGVAADLAGVVAGLIERWNLTLGPFLDSHVSFTALVSRGVRDAVLKIPMAGDFAHVSGNLRFQEHEALGVWGGEAAARLLDFDPATGAMLLERCVPGAQLADTVTLEEADEIAADLMQRLWRPVPVPHPFSSLDDFAVELGRRAQVNHERAARRSSSRCWTKPWSYWVSCGQRTQHRCSCTETCITRTSCPPSASRGS
jgi:streptomycin 6-kinase